MNNNVFALSLHCQVEFVVKFRGTPQPQISWYKDGFEIFSSRRMKVVTEGEQSSLVIFQASFTDEGELKCTATNRMGHVVTRAKLRLEGINLSIVLNIVSSLNKALKYNKHLDIKTLILRQLCNVSLAVFLGLYAKFGIY